MALALCLSMVPAFTSCGKKKKDTKKRQIEETDPFFDTEVYQLKPPVDETKTITYCSVSHVECAGNAILMQYSISYEIPSDAYSREDFSFSDYYKEGTAVFDLSGNLVSDKPQAFAEGGSMEGVTSDSEGNLVMLSSEYDFDDPEDVRLRITFQNSSGETVKEIIPEIPKDVDAYSLNRISILSDGKIVLQSYFGATSPVCVYDKDGKLLFTVTAMDRAIVSGLFSKNGKYYVLTTTPEFFFEDAPEIRLDEIDMTSGALKPGEKVKGIRDPLSITTGEDGLYTTTPNGIRKYNPDSAKMEEVLDWNQTDIDRGLLYSAQSFPKNENEIHAIATDYGSDFSDTKYYLISLRRADKNPHAGKKIIYIGGKWIADSFYDYVNRYNADPKNDLRIETTDYFYLENEDGQYSDAAVVNNVYFELMGGNAPDILLNFAGCDQFATAGLLEDMNPYIDGENGLDRSKYFDNIFRSMESNGKLYFAPLRFAIGGFMVNPELIKAERNWTFDDMDQAAASLAEGVRLVPKMKCEELLEAFMGPDYTDYMDYDKKEVHFASPEMERVLEETKKYAAKEENVKEAHWVLSVPGDAKYEGLKGLDKEPVQEYENIGLLLYTQSCAMSEVQIDSFQDYHIFSSVIPEGGKLLGYPTSSGKGVIALPYSSASIVSSSGFKDEAWEIIKSLYSEDAQIEAGALPMNRAAFEKNGKEDLEKIGRVYDAFLKEKQSSDFTYFPADPDMVDEIKGIVEEIKYSMHRDEAVLEIIKEETGGYFYDTRSAQEVLKNVDNRARQVVQER